jgi:hypothetical protein
VAANDACETAEAINAKHTRNESLISLFIVVSRLQLAAARNFLRTDA